MKLRRIHSAYISVICYDREEEYSLLFDDIKHKRPSGTIIRPLATENGTPA